MIVFKIDSFSFFVSQTLSSQNGRTLQKFFNYPSFFYSNRVFIRLFLDIHIKPHNLIGFCIQQN